MYVDMVFCFLTSEISGTTSESSTHILFNKKSTQNESPFLKPPNVPSEDGFLQIKNYRSISSHEIDRLISVKACL
jgi:hypothetical protein